MLDWSRDALAAAARVNARTTADFESGRRQPIAATLSALRTAFETAGVIFVEANGEEPGVRLRKG
jgi:hypothetical protein